MDKFKHIPKLIAIFVALVVYMNGQAQQENMSCYNALKQADKEYNIGRFAESLELLKPCLTKFDKEIEFEVYRLMALCYLSLHDEKNAGEYAKKLLIRKPDYKDFPYFDPAEFTQLLSNYEVWPKWEIGLGAGVNFNSVRLIKNYSFSGSSYKYLPETGYQTMVNLEYDPWQRISFSSGIKFEGLNYSQTSDLASGWNSTLTEKLRFFTIPLCSRFYFLKSKKLDLAFEIGAQMQMINSSRSNVLHSNSATGERIQNSADQGGQRSSKLFYGLTGVLLKYKVGGGSLVTSAQFAYGLNNVVNEEKRYQNVEFIMDNQHVDSDFSFNPFYISLGYQFPFWGYEVKNKRK